MLYYHKINGKNDIQKTEKLKANLAEIIETLMILEKLIYEIKAIPVA